MTPNGYGTALEDMAAPCDLWHCHEVPLRYGLLHCIRILTSSHRATGGHGRRSRRLKGHPRTAALMTRSRICRPAPQNGPSHPQALRSSGEVLCKRNRRDNPDGSNVQVGSAPLATFISWEAIPPRTPTAPMRCQRRVSDLRLRALPLAS